MIPEFQSDGNLPPGVHLATWPEIEDRFGTTPWRRRLLAGLRDAAANLRSAGCPMVYVDGSFVTAKIRPGDFDACWAEQGVDVQKLDSVLLRFDDGRAAQKAKYGGEFFPASALETSHRDTFLNFFQVDKETGDRKGIIALDIGGSP